MRPGHSLWDGFTITYFTRDVVLNFLIASLSQAYCRTTDKRRKCANLVNGFICLLKTMVKGFGRDVKETGYVAVFIVMMSIGDS